MHAARPWSKTDLADCTATELLALYRARQASPLEATRAVLARIERLNPTLNAFSFVAADEALAAAQSSEERWRRGGPCGALDGVPVSIKDLVLTRGMPTLRGSRTVDAAQAWEIDAPAAARLRESGAVLLGKTTTPEFGCKGETNSLLTGISRNPWNPRQDAGRFLRRDRGRGGSGHGANLGRHGRRGQHSHPGCLLRQRRTEAELRRVRLSAIVFRYGVARRTTHHERARRCLTLNVLAQRDARDWTSLPPEGRDYTAGLEKGIRGLKVAWSPSLGYAKNVEPGGGACEQAIHRLADLGAEIEAVDPGIEDPLQITCGLWFVGAWTLWNTLTPHSKR